MTILVGLEFGCWETRMGWMFSCFLFLQLWFMGFVLIDTLFHAKSVSSRSSDASFGSLDVVW